MTRTQIAGLFFLGLGTLYVLLATQASGILELLGNLVGGVLFFLGIVAQFAKIHKP